MRLSPGARAQLDQMRAEINELVGLIAEHKALACEVDSCPSPQALDQVAARDCGHRLDLLMQTLIVLWEERAAHAKTVDNFETYVESHIDASGDAL